MDIRPLNEADHDTFLSLRLRALKDHPEAYQSSYEEEAIRPPEHFIQMLREKALPHDFILAAFTDGKGVAMLGFRQNDRRKIAHKGSIWGVYVAPEYRGQGLAKALMLRAMEIARECKGLEQIHLTVVSSNTNAHKLYLGLGFQDWGVEPDAIRINDEYEDEIHMVKYLK
jgi:ribosomal protein S18 acetylase RimI-like enzyme